ncbi:hypothetical protein [Streptomyces sp. NPDC055607]
MPGDLADDGLTRDTSGITIGDSGVRADGATVERLLTEGLLEYGTGVTIGLTDTGRQRLRELESTGRAEPAVGDRVLLVGTGTLGIVGGYQPTEHGIRIANVVCDREGWPNGWDTNVAAMFLTTVEPAAMDPAAAAERYRVAALRQFPGTLTDPALRTPALEALTAAALADPQVAQAARTNDANNFVVALAAWTRVRMGDQWENTEPEQWPDWVRAYFRQGDQAVGHRNGLYSELAGSLYERLHTQEPDPAPAPAPGDPVPAPAPADELTPQAPRLVNPAPTDTRADWGLVDGEEITYTGQFDGRYTITLPGSSYLLFQPSLQYRRTGYFVALDDQDPGVTPKRLHTFEDPDEILPWLRNHASQRQTGYVFRDGAWSAVEPDTARLPLLDVVDPDPELLPTVFDALPYTSDTGIQQDVDRLATAYERWNQMPTVQAYIQQDQDARPTGLGTPENPIAALRAAYAQAESTLKGESLEDPYKALHDISMVAAWGQVLLPAVNQGLQEPLEGLYGAAHLLCVRAKATIEDLAGKAEQPPRAPASAPAATKTTVEPSAEPAALDLVAAAHEVAPAPYWRIVGAETDEQATARFGGGELLDAFAARVQAVPAPSALTDTSAEVWMDGRLIGRIADINDAADYTGPGGAPLWSAEPVFGTAAEHLARFRSQKAALAELAVRALRSGPPAPDRLDEDMVASFTTHLVLPLPQVPGNDPVASARLTELAAVLEAFAQGHSLGASIADDLALAHDSLLWLAATQSDARVRDDLETRAEMITTYLGVFRPEDPRAAQNRTAAAPQTPAPDRTTAPDQTAERPAGEDDEQLDLFPSETPTAPAPKRRTARRRGRRAKEPANPPRYGEGAVDGRTGVYGHADHGECDRCGTPDTARYTVVWEWYNADRAAMAAECAPCVELTTGLAYPEIARLADLAEARRDGLRIQPDPHRGGDVTTRRTADKEWTQVHLPTGKRYRIARESESGYRGYTTRDLHGISHGTNVGLDEEVARRHALGHTAETHPNSSDSWVLFGYRQDLKNVLLHDGESVESQGTNPRFQGVFEHGPRWDLIISEGPHGEARYLVELVYQSGPQGEDGHRLEITAPDRSSTRHVHWDGALEWAREHARTAPPAPTTALTQEQATARDDVPQPQPAVAVEQPPAPEVSPEPASTIEELPLPQENTDGQEPVAARQHNGQPPASTDTDDDVQIEDPPEPQRYTEVVPMAADPAYELHLFGVDGHPPGAGSLRHNGAPVAAVRPSAFGPWFASLTVYGAPADVTGMTDSPQEAAHQAAMLYSALTRTPYGRAPVAAADGMVSRIDMVRADMRDLAQVHLAALTEAVGQVSAEASRIPQSQEVAVHLNAVAGAVDNRHDFEQMSANLAALQQAVTAWTGVLPDDTDLDERQRLAFPLAHLLYDTRRLEARLQATLEAEKADQTERAQAGARETTPARNDSRQSDPAPLTGPTVSLGLRPGSGAQVIAEFHAEEISHTAVLPGVSLADLHRPLPSTSIELPALRRAPQRQEHLVSDEEAEQWLDAHLPGSRLGMPWSSPALRTALTAMVRDDLRDMMAPDVSDVAAWLVQRAIEDDGLLEVAHIAADAADFRTHFARAADALVREGVSEHLRWTYFGREGERRDGVLDRAAPQAYARLQAMPAPTDERAVPPSPAPTNADALEDPEMTTPARPEEPASAEDTAPAPAPETTPGDPELGGAAPAGVQRFAVVLPVPADEQHLLYLESEDEDAYSNKGEVRRADVTIATVHRTVAGLWYARMQLLGSPDMTPVVDDPVTAAEHAALMHAVFTNSELGGPVEAAPGFDGQARAAQIRSELREFADRHAASIETAVRQLSPGYAQNPHYAELAARLADVADAEGRGPIMMAADLAGVERAVNDWGGTLPQSPVSESRSALVFPLAHALFDVRRLQARLQATVELVQREQDRQREAAAAAAAESTTPAPVAAETPVAEAPPIPEPPAEVIEPPVSETVEPAAGEPETPAAPEAGASPEGSADEAAAELSSYDDLEDDLDTEELFQPPRPPHELGPYEAPSYEETEGVQVPPPAEEADENTKAPAEPFPDEIGELTEETPEGPTTASDTVSPATRDEHENVLYGDELEVEPTAGDMGEPEPLAPGPSSEPSVAAAVPELQEPAAPEPMWGTVDLPVTAYPAREDPSERGSGEGDADDAALAQFQEFMQAWDANVQDGGTSAELHEDVRADLITLDRLFGEAIDGAPALAPEASPSEPRAARDAHQEAAAVNAALHEADVRASSLQDLPEWQKIQTVRGAMGHLFTVIKKRAGEHLDRLLGDERAGGFLREMSARACDKIAGWAQVAARKLRGDTAGPGELPSAEALLRLGDAAFTYSTPRRRGTPPPPPGGGGDSEVDVRALRKMGEALAKPMPGARTRVSAAAAKSRSTTVKRPAQKGAASSSEQTAHLRRRGPDQAQPRKPQR